MVSALIVAVAIVLALLVFDRGAGRIYGYALTPTRFEIRLFGRFPIYGVALRDITGAVMWRPTLADIAMSFTTLRAGNRIFGRAVVIVLAGGFPRRIIVTPDDPGRFIAELRSTVALGTRAGEAHGGV